MAKIFTFKNKRTMPRWLAVIISWFVRLYCITLRVKVVKDGLDEEQLGRQGRVLVTWHNRILFAAPLAPRILRKYVRPLVSASRDGEYISTVVKCFGYSVVRGSSSRGGLQALLELRRCLKRCEVPLLTVDGPRGPQYCVHPGAALLAQSGKVPVIPMVLNSESYWQLKSWDHMQIPKPFSRVTLTFGEPIEIPEGISIEDGCGRIGDLLRRYTVDREEEQGACRAAK